MPMNPSAVHGALFSMILYALTFGVAGAAPQDPLWRKAIEVTRENRGWIPGLVVMRSEVLHGGKVEGVQEIWQR
jgi:hypothetical protein